MLLEEGIGAFETHCRVRRQLAPRTVKNFYGYPLRSIFLPWCLEEGGAGHLADLTGDVVDRFTMSLDGRLTRDGAPIKPATKVAYLKAVRHFLTWAEEYGAPGTAERIGLPRLRKVKRDVLTDGEYRRLEEAARNERDKLILRIMWETAAREGEVASVRTADVMERGRGLYFVRVRGKTGERMPPISAELYRRLRAYASGKTGRPRTNSEALFIADRRRPHGDYESLTESGIYRAVKDAADRADLGKRVYAHLLRHSAITRMIARGLHPVLVSEITGVSLAVIAQNYSHPSDKQMWEAAMKVLEG